MEKEERPSGILSHLLHIGIDVDCGCKLVIVILMYVGFEVSDGYGVVMLCEDFGVP